MCIDSTQRAVVDVDLIADVLLLMSCCHTDYVKEWFPFSTLAPQSILGTQLQRLHISKKLKVDIPLGLRIKPQYFILIRSKMFLR